MLEEREEGYARGSPPPPPPAARAAPAHNASKLSAVSKAVLREKYVTVAVPTAGRGAVGVSAGGDAGGGTRRARVGS